MKTTNQPYFRKMTEDECLKHFGFSKKEMEELYNNGESLFSKKELFGNMDKLDNFGDEE